MNNLSSPDSLDRVRREPQDHTTLQRLSHACRRFENMNALLEELAGVVADAAGIGRMLVFLKDREDGAFRFRCGFKHSGASTPVTFSETDSLPLWLELNAHLVSRATLSSISSVNDRLMLEHALKEHSAEALVPLYGRHELLGWLFAGHRTSGRPYNDSYLLELAVYAEHMAITVENALLHEKVAEQQALTEMLIRHLPDGVVAVDQRGVVRWANPQVCEVLSLPGESMVGQPVEHLGSRVADSLRRCLGNRPDEATREWDDPATLRPASITTQRLRRNGHNVGAMAVIHDRSPDERLKRQEVRTTRKAFFQGLAAMVGHEVRNMACYLDLPLEAFCNGDAREPILIELADAGRKRLRDLPALYDRFVNMADPVFESCGVESLIKEAVQDALAKAGTSNSPVRLECPVDMPALDGDRGLLVECFSRILVNAMEALGESPGREIRVKAMTKGRDRDHLFIEFTDNGPGLDDGVREDPFSPFTTTKCWPGAGLRHIGLGLPVVHQTVLDHNGRVNIDSDSGGTRVTITLPAHRSEART